MAKQLSVEQRIQRANVQLMKSDQFCSLSGILMCGTNTVHDDPTMRAKTNGWNTKYGREFMSELDEQTFNWVVVHENMHKALKQLTIWKHLVEKSGSKANAAADFVINLLIESMDPNHVVTKRWPSALYDEQFRGMDTGQVFALLDKVGGSGPSLDDHDWENTEAAEASEQDIDQAIRQGAILASQRNANEAARLLSRLIQPKIDWRHQLREFVTSVSSGKDFSTWRHPSRRGLSRGIMMPGMRGESMGPMVVAVDASGSIDSEMLIRFASELAGICETVSPEKVYVVWWHHRVANVQVFTQDEYNTMAENLQPAGTGCTDPRCVIDWMLHENITADCLLFLTDGYVGDCWPQPVSMPTLWAITSDVVAPHGITIKLD